MLSNDWNRAFRRVLGSFKPWIPPLFFFLFYRPTIFHKHKRSVSTLKNSCVYITVHHSQNKLYIHNSYNSSLRLILIVPFSIVSFRMEAILFTKKCSLCPTGYIIKKKRLDDLRNRRPPLASIVRKWESDHLF